MMPTDPSGASEKRYGYSADEWAAMVDSAYAVLADTARRKTTITYRDFCARADLKMAAHEWSMNVLLDDLAQRSIREHGHIVSAVLVQADGVHQSQPGAGFFQYASRVGMLKKKPTNDDRLIFWTEQITKAYTAFKG